MVGKGGGGAGDSGPTTPIPPARQVALKMVGMCRVAPEAADTERLACATKELDKGH